MESDCNLDALIEDTLLDLESCGATYAPTSISATTSGAHQESDGRGASQPSSKHPFTPQEAVFHAVSGYSSRRLDSGRTTSVSHQGASAAVACNSMSTADDDTVCVEPPPEDRKRRDGNAPPTLPSWRASSNKTPATPEQCSESCQDALEEDSSENPSSRTRVADPLAFCLKELESELEHLQNAPAPPKLQDQSDKGNGHEGGGLLQLLETLSRALEAVGCEGPGEEDSAAEGVPGATMDSKGKGVSDALSGVDNLLESLEQEMPLEAIAEPLQQLLAVYEPWLSKEKLLYRGKCEKHGPQEQSCTVQSTLGVSSAKGEEITRCEKQIATYRRIVALCSQRHNGSKDDPQSCGAAEAAESGLSRLLQVQQLLEEASALGDPPEEVLHALNELDACSGRTDSTRSKPTDSNASPPPSRESVKNAQKPFTPSSLHSAVGSNKSAASTNAIEDELLDESDIKDFVGFVGVLQQAAAEEGVNLLDPQLLQQVLASGDTTDSKIERLLDRVEMHQQQRKSHASPHEGDTQRCDQRNNAVHDGGQCRGQY